MIITTYTKTLGWIATAQFPHANNPYKYHEFDYRGFGESPQEAIGSLMAQLEANTFVYDYIYFIPERLTRYSPATYYDSEHKLWCVKMEYQQRDGGDTDVVLVFGDSPEAALSRLFESAIRRGVHVSPEQAREAQDLLTV